MGAQERYLLGTKNGRTIGEHATFNRTPGRTPDATSRTPAASPSITPLESNPTPFVFPAKDSSERIKVSEVPKFDGKKEVEAWVIEFKKYCRLIKMRTSYWQQGLQ